MRLAGSLGISVAQGGSDPFYTPTALATVQKAAEDVSFAITTTLSGLSSLHYSGTNGATTATADWTLSYLNPDDGTSTVGLSTVNLPANDFHIYLGSRALTGATLGLGAPGGAGNTVNASGNLPQLPGALANLETNSNSGMTRGGPVLGELGGSLGGVGYDLDFGYAVGSLAFDSDTNWNLDYNTLPSAGQYDLYTVAVHEILHTLGLGGGATWTSHSNGTDWTGTTVISLIGTGTDVLSPGLDHINQNLSGHPLVDGTFQPGVSQTTIMAPALLAGTRRYITDVDLAFLTDMGWRTVSVPEAGSAILLLAAGLALMGGRSRRGPERDS